MVDASPIKLTPAHIAGLGERLDALPPEDFFISIGRGELAALLVAARKLAAVQEAGQKIRVVPDLEAMVDLDAGIPCRIDASAETLAALFSAVLVACDHPGMPEVQAR